MNSGFGQKQLGLYVFGCIDLFGCESLSLRTSLGAGGYGPVHSPDHRIWHSPRNCRWTVTVPDVPASDSRAIVAEVSQHGQRSVVSVPPMAGQSSSVGGGRNQDRTLRAAFAPVCGATCWKPKERVPGSNFVLDNRGPGGEAERVST